MATPSKPALHDVLPRRVGRWWLDRSPWAQFLLGLALIPLIPVLAIVAVIYLVAMSMYYLIAELLDT